MGATSLIGATLLSLLRKLAPSVWSTLTRTIQHDL